MTATTTGTARTSRRSRAAAKEAEHLQLEENHQNKMNEDAEDDDDADHHQHDDDEAEENNAAATNGGSRRKRGSAAAGGSKRGGSTVQRDADGFPVPPPKMAAAASDASKPSASKRPARAAATKATAAGGRPAEQAPPPHMKATANIAAAASRGKGRGELAGQPPSSSRRQRAAARHRAATLSTGGRTLGGRKQTHSQLFGVICLDSPEDFLAELKEWYHIYESDQHGALVTFINLILESAGFPEDLIEAVDAQDKPKTEVIDEMVATIDKRQVVIGERYPLITKERVFRNFHANFISFWTSVIVNFEREFIVADGLAEFADWLAHLSSSKIRRIRHAGALAAFGVCDGILESYKAVCGRLELSKRQRETEKRSARQETVEEIQRQIALAEEEAEKLLKLLSSLLTSVFTLRVKDVAEVIRGEALSSLARWSRIVPERFLSARNYSKYFGYALFDSNADVRAAAMSFLAEVFENESMLKHIDASGFLKFFQGPILEAMLDSDIRVRSSALLSLKQLEAFGKLTDQQVERVVECLWSPALAIRGPNDLLPTDDLVLQYLASFVDGTFFAFSVCSPFEASDSRGEASSTPEVASRDIRSILQFVDMYSSPARTRIICERLVVGFWNKAPALRNVRLLLDLLTVEQHDRSQAEDSQNGNSSQIEEGSRLPLLCILLTVLRLMKQSVSHEESETTASTAVKDPAVHPVGAAEHATAIVEIFNSLPALLKLFKAEPRHLEIALSCGYEAAKCAAGVQAQLRVTQTVASLVETFLHQSDSQVLDAVAATLSQLQATLESDAAAVALKVQDILQKTREIFRVAYLSWKNLPLSKSENFAVGAADGAADVEECHKHAVMMLTSVRKFCAMTKAGITNPFANQWGMLDKLLEVLKANPVPIISKQDEELKRQSEILRSATLGTRLLASETLLGAYLHVWCDIILCCHSIETSIASTSAERHGDSEPRKDERKRPQPTDEEEPDEAEDGLLHQSKKRKLGGGKGSGAAAAVAALAKSSYAAATTAFRMGLQGGRRELDGSASTSSSASQKISSGDVEQLDMAALIGRAQKLIAISRQLQQEMLKAYTEILGEVPTTIKVEGAGVGERIALLVKFDAAAGIVQLTSCAKLSDCFANLQKYKNPQSVAELESTDGEELSPTSAQMKENITTLANCFQALEFKLAPETTTRVFNIFRGLLAECSSIDIEDVPLCHSWSTAQPGWLPPQLRDSPAGLAAARSSFACTRTWRLLDVAKDFAECGMAVVIQEQTEEPVEGVKPIDVDKRLMQMIVVWATATLSGYVADSAEPAFWDSQTASLLLTMLTEEDRLELQYAAEHMLDLWKRAVADQQLAIGSGNPKLLNGSGDNNRGGGDKINSSQAGAVGSRMMDLELIVWRRLYQSVKTLCTFEKESLHAFAGAIYRFLGITFYRETKRGFTEFAKNCLSFALADDGQHAELLTLVSPAIPRSAILDDSLADGVAEHLKELRGDKNFSVDVENALKDFAKRLGLRDAGAISGAASRPRAGGYRRPRRASRRERGDDDDDDESSESSENSSSSGEAEEVEDAVQETSEPRHGHRDHGGEEDAEAEQAAKAADGKSRRRTPADAEASSTQPRQNGKSREASNRVQPAGGSGSRRVSMRDAASASQHAPPSDNVAAEPVNEAGRVSSGRRRRGGSVETPAGGQMEIVSPESSVQAVTQEPAAADAVSARPRRGRSSSQQQMPDVESSGGTSSVTSSAAATLSEEPSSASRSVVTPPTGTGRRLRTRASQATTTTPAELTTLSITSSTVSVSTGRDVSSATDSVTPEDVEME